MHVEYEWGSTFIKHIGKKTKTEAVQQCSDIKPKEFTGKMNLPIPRFAEEMDFYRVLFDEPWLDVSRDSETGLLESKNGHIYEIKASDDAPFNFYKNYHRTELLQGNRILKFDWLVTNETTANLTNFVTLTKDGIWNGTSSESKHDAVCVFNVDGDVSCSRCHSDAFCRYRNGYTTDTECICPIQVRA